MSKSLLSLKNITKTYPGVVALDDVSFDFAAGEVHALVGENGAGKSTLIKVMAGAIEPDSGSIDIEGTVHTALTPAQTGALGIEVIYQEFNLVDTLSAAENICLGRRFGRFVDYREMNKIARSIFGEFGVDIDPAMLVRDLPSSQQQIVEIAKAVSKNAKLLIMDEPTAPLTVSEVETLFRIIRSARERGVGIVYISHRLDEVFAISDKVSVIRDGHYIDTLVTSQTSRKELISLMVGRELKETYPARKPHSDEVVLDLQGVTGNGDVDISFSLRKGEILGLAGLVGAGRTELVKVIYGAEALEAGKIFVNGVESKIRTPHDALKSGIGLIPEDRKGEGCFLEMSVKWNISFAAIRQLSRGLIVDRAREDERTRHFEKAMQIKTPSIMQQVKNLSGGNQQKVVLAKTLAAGPQIIIFDEPTRGIDVGARQEIYRLMCSLLDEGHSIIMISSDMEELLGMSDRIVVIAEGRVSGMVEKKDFSQQLILELASGFQEESPAKKVEI